MKSWNVFGGRSLLILTNDSCGESLDWGSLIQRLPINPWTLLPSWWGTCLQSGWGYGRCGGRPKVKWVNSWSSTFWFYINLILLGQSSWDNDEEPVGCLRRDGSLSWLQGQGVMPTPFSIAGRWGAACCSLNASPVIDLFCEGESRGGREGPGGGEWLLWLPLRGDQPP